MHVFVTWAVYTVVSGQRLSLSALTQINGPSYPHDRKLCGSQWRSIKIDEDIKSSLCLCCGTEPRLFSP